MKPDGFEEQLRTRPLRQVPSSWREKILAMARQDAGCGLETQPTYRVSWWKELLWPSPIAWAGLVCIWLVILTLQFGRESSDVVSRNSLSPAPASLNALAEHRRLMTELTTLLAPPAEADRPKPPGPSSERRRFIATV